MKIIIWTFNVVVFVRVTHLKKSINFLLVLLSTLLSIDIKRKDENIIALVYNFTIFIYLVEKVHQMVLIVNTYFCLEMFCSCIKNFFVFYCSTLFYIGKENFLKFSMFDNCKNIGYTFNSVISALSLWKTNCFVQITRETSLYWQFVTFYASLEST